MSFSPKQQQVLEFGFTDYDALICDGSVRSGKSSVISIAYILWAMSNFHNKNFIIASQSISSADRNIIKPLLAIEYIHENFSVKWMPSSKLLMLGRGKTVNYFYIFGGKDESSFQTVQGITAAGAFLDEVALMPESFANQVLARCSVEGSKYWFSCNPESPNHWFYQKWVKKADDKNALYLHFTMDDNPSLSDNVKKRYQTMYTGVFYDRYILGRWVKAEGIIYRKFADENKKYLLNQVPNDIIMVNVGVDFGGNKSATTFVATGFSKGMNNVYVLEAERHHYEMTPNEMDELFVRFCDMVYDKYKIAFTTRADNAEPILIRGLKNAALRAQCRTNVKPALKKSVLSRIKLINKLLGLERFYIMDHCKTVIEALNTAVWDDKKIDVRLDDLVTCDIDTLDAMEYAIEEYMKVLVDIE